MPILQAEIRGLITPGVGRMQSNKDSSTLVGESKQKIHLLMTVSTQEYAEHKCMYDQRHQEVAQECAQHFIMQNSPKQKWLSVYQQDNR